MSSFTTMFNTSVKVNDFALTPTLRAMVQRYLTDERFQRGLHFALTDTLARAEILLTEEERGTLTMALDLIRTPGGLSPVDIYAWCDDGPIGGD